MVVFTSLEKIYPNDWIIILSNVIFFMVVQTLFFRYVASKQYESVLKNKLSLVQKLSDKDESLKEVLTKFKVEYLAENNEKIGIQKRNRELANNQLETRYSWVYVAYAVIALLIVFTFTNQRWQPVHSLGLIMVVFAYITELYFFFFIVQKYEFVGDHYLYSKIYNKVTREDKLKFNAGKSSDTDRDI
jgi:lipopolysaccharide export LptBFGC system permease protein LptF